MIGVIQSRILYLLNVSSLYAGGNDWAAGWTGAVAVYSGDAAQSGYVNLHLSREKMEPIRPAVYMGTKTYTYQDTLHKDMITADGSQIRRLFQPIVVVCKDTTLSNAQKQATQLADNIKSILCLQASRRQLNNNWIVLTVRGSRSTESATGSDASDVAEARAIVDVEILYLWQPAANAVTAEECPEPFWKEYRGI